jgi:hypothetical protein
MDFYMKKQQKHQLRFILLITDIVVKPKTEIGICCFSAKHAKFRRKSKDWLARNQENVSEWGRHIYLRIVASVSYHYD